MGIVLDPKQAISDLFSFETVWSNYRWATNWKWIILAYLHSKKKILSPICIDLVIESSVFVDLVNHNSYIRFAINKHDCFLEQSQCNPAHVPRSILATIPRGCKWIIVRFQFVDYDRVLIMLFCLYLRTIIEFITIAWTFKKCRNLFWIKNPP